MNKTIKWAHCEADPTEFSNFFHSSQLCYSIYLSVVFTYSLVLQVYNAVLDAIDVSDSLLSLYIYPFICPLLGSMIPI